MPTPRVLLLGGHGKVSLLLTPHLLARSWHVTSMIRDEAQKPEIVTAGGGSGYLDVLVASLDDVKSDDDAKKILDKAKPDYVVWSAGAGGKGGPSQTFHIDRDVCQRFIRTSISTPSIKRFLLVSAILCRRQRAPWWDDEGYEAVQKVANSVMPTFYKAKLAADETLTTLGEERRKKDSTFSYVVLRPGTLSDDDATGKIALGHTAARAPVTRADVADVAARLLDSEASGWFDLINGKTDTQEEIARVLSEGEDSLKGESLEKMGGEVGSL